MAIDAIRKDLLKTIKSGDTMDKLREFQFKSQCVCISHDPKRIAITGWNALVTMADSTKNKNLLNFVNKEEKIVKNIILFEAERVFGDPANVTKMHIKHGYTIHQSPKQIMKATGHLKTGNAKTRKPAGKHVLIGTKAIGGPAIEKNMPFQGGSLGVTCQYVGSLDKRERDAMDKAMYKFMMKNVSEKINIRNFTKYQSDYSAADKMINQDLTNPFSKKKQNHLGKLHGPTASKVITGKMGKSSTMASTDFENDTSVPLVGIVERLKEIAVSPALLKDMEKNKQYDTAIDDILTGLDAEFKINQRKISDIVKNQREINIHMSLGDVSLGSLQQKEMTHADAANVRRIIRLISKDLLANNSDPDYKASTSFVQDYQRIVPGQVIANMIKKDGTPDMRFKANKGLITLSKKKSDKRTKTNAKETLKGKNSTKTIKAKKVTAKKIRGASAMMGMGVEGATTSPIALKELIQAQLAERLLDNMGTPALVNRTGRFRRSAQVQNVMVGPRGGTEVQYTYMKDPYATFEPGGDMGSRDRDPRRIIGGTIREIAMELTGNKFIRTRSL